MSKRIKVFLGGYVNFLNAQNINCRALSEHLNKERFEVWTMTFWYQNANDFKKLPGVHYLHAYRSIRFLGWIPYFIGLLRCDVAYLPKGGYMGLCRAVAKLSRCKIFNTVEGILSASDLAKVPDSDKMLADYRQCEPHLYAITRHIQQVVSQKFGFNFAQKILYLGVESKQFLNSVERQRPLQQVVFIGNNLINKGIDDFFKISKAFPSLSFHIIGANNLWNEERLEDYLQRENLSNVTYHGRLDHTRMAALLQHMDLMFFPSRSEGFPKVMLETASAGVPTLCYDDYGAQEWITSGKDGFVVHTYDEAVAVVEDLVAHPEKLPALSQHAIELGKRFDWSRLVKDWEEVIEEIYKG